MAINHPLPFNFRGNRTLVPAKWDAEPREGNKVLSCEIDWGDPAVSGVNSCVVLNMQNNATLELSQIVALTIDNSECGSDVRISFPDSPQTYTISSKTPEAVIPVFTGSLELVVYAVDGANPGDITRMIVHNKMPPPVTLPLTFHQQTAKSQSIPMDAPSIVSILPAGTYGTIEAITLSSTIIDAANDYLVQIDFYDGAGNYLFAAQSGGVAGGTVDGPIFGISPCAVRFEDGLELRIDGTDPGPAPNGTLSYNVLYSQP